MTPEGRELLEEHRRDDGRDDRQEFYADVKKVRELTHDAHVYRAYLRAADRLTEAGGRIERVVLDYELKREYQAFCRNAIATTRQRWAARSGRFRDRGLGT